MNEINLKDDRWRPKYRVHWLPMIPGVQYYTSRGKLVKEHNDEICRKKGIKSIHENYPNNDDHMVANEGDESWLRLNHYIIKSKEDFEKKKQNVVFGLEWRYNETQFNMHDKNCNMTDASIQEKYIK